MTFLDGRLSRKFWDRVIPEPMSGCWLWIGGTANEYGFVRFDGARTYAHRASYTALVGPIADGLHIDHLCRNTLCVNPAHLEPVTPRENALRGVSPLAFKASQLSCVNGHPFDDENTYIRKDRVGCRECRQCCRDRREAAREGR